MPIISTNNIHKNYLTNLDSRINSLEDYSIYLGQHIEILYSSIRHLAETESLKPVISEEISNVDVETITEKVSSLEHGRNDGIKNFTDPVSTNNIQEKYITDLNTRTTFLENHFISLAQHIETLYSSIRYLGVDNNDSIDSLISTENPKQDKNSNAEELNQAEIASSEHDKNNTMEKFQSVDLNIQSTYKMKTLNQTKVPSSESSKHNTVEEHSKADISEQLTSKLLQEANDANLRIRKNALETIFKIVNDSKKIGTNLGDLHRILKLRLSDNNIDIQIISLDICVKIVTAMGSPFKKYAKPFINLVTEALKNPKNSAVREHAISCLRCFESVIGVPSVEKTLSTKNVLLQKDSKVKPSNHFKDANKKNNLFNLQENKDDAKIATKSCSSSNVKSTDHDSKLKGYGSHKGSVKQTNEAGCPTLDIKPTLKEKNTKELGQKSNSKGNKNQKLSILPKPTGSLAMKPHRINKSHPIPPDKKKKATNMEYSIPANNKHQTMANSIGISPTEQSISERNSISSVKVAMSKIMDSELHKCIGGLKQLNKQLNTSFESIVSYAPELINILTDKIAQLDSQSQINIQLCKDLLKTLYLLFSNKKLALAVPQNLLEQLLSELTRHLSDSNLQKQEAGQQLLIALRISINKVLLNSKRNLIYSALLSILKRSSAKLQEVNEPIIIEFTEFIMKYLQHLSKYLPNDIKSCILCPNKLLRDLDEFLISIPPSEWERRTKENMSLGEMPFNIIQNLLKKLVEGLGENIYDHLGFITDAKKSYIYSYMKKELCKGKETNNLSTDNNVNT
ncbi:armadillo-type protein [Gigaspora rosea]|uniref:Armadillo-type protein n=1 Tax=Gigaspora rosea TaxID=44941 RepID=A0A397W854_9GLOM|nr:armadillo-type protein [Gigaspora rosea]